VKSNISNGSKVSREAGAIQVRILVLCSLSSHGLLIGRLGITNDNPTLYESISDEMYVLSMCRRNKINYAAFWEPEACINIFYLHQVDKRCGMYGIFEDISCLSRKSCLISSL
jgi:hypothetical protein